jgi:hypothetical protein
MKTKAKAEVGLNHESKIVELMDSDTGNRGIMPLFAFLTREMISKIHELEGRDLLWGGSDPDQPKKTFASR